jgi:hypothetical protein
MRLYTLNWRVSSRDPFQVTVPDIFLHLLKYLTKKVKIARVAAKIRNEYRRIANQES